MYMYQNQAEYNHYVSQTYTNKTFLKELYSTTLFFIDFSHTTTLNEKTFFWIYIAITFISFTEDAFQKNNLRDSYFLLLRT